MPNVWSFLFLGHREIKMKKFIVSVGLMLITSVSYAKPYLCVGYLDGAVVGEITVNADKAAVAETKGIDRLRKSLGGKKASVDFMKCK